MPRRCSRLAKEDRGRDCLDDRDLPISFQEILALLLVRHLPATLMILLLLGTSILVRVLRLNRHFRLLLQLLDGVGAGIVGFRPLAGGSLCRGVFGLPPGVGRLRLGGGRLLASRPRRGLGLLAVAAFRELTGLTHAAGGAGYAPDRLLRRALAGRGGHFRRLLLRHAGHARRDGDHRVRRLRRHRELAVVPAAVGVCQHVQSVRGIGIVLAEGILNGLRLRLRRYERLAVDTNHRVSQRIGCDRADTCAWYAEGGGFGRYRRGQGGPVEFDGVGCRATAG